MIQVGIVGTSGYVAGELIRILIHHPSVKLNFLYSHSQSGKSLTAIHDDLIGYEHLILTHEINPSVDVLFLCLGHGHSRAFLDKHKFSDQTVIIDLSNDFRLDHSNQMDAYQFTYGLPELQKVKVIQSKAIANPGCFATAIQTGLLPFAKAGQLKKAIHVHAITGSTGAGKGLSETSHFSWRNNNISVYKVLKHQHLDEIRQSLVALQPDFDEPILFVPMRGDFTRGILASIYFESELAREEIESLFKAFYKDEVFIHLSEQTVHLKQVINTNNGLIQITKEGGIAHLTVVIDNLIKGAAGQAIQNMNLIYNLPENMGLQLKPNYF